MSEPYKGEFFEIVCQYFLGYVFFGLGWGEVLGFFFFGGYVVFVVL